jgi:hypothetical protein
MRIIDHHTGEGAMMRYLWRAFLAAAATAAGCAVDETDTVAIVQPGMSMQGMSMQGMSMQGMSMQGMSMQGMSMQGMTLGGLSLSNVRVEKGELIADKGFLTLRGLALSGTRLHGLVVSDTDPQQVIEVEYKIASIIPESPLNDPTHTGGTYLYTLDQKHPTTGAWVPACTPDPYGQRVAIPLAATWNSHGDRVEIPGMFTFGCVSGVIAKCYRWGYRPWVTGYGDLVSMHQACTRMARADYCGNGESHTHEGTWINVWDTLSPHIQTRGWPPLGYLFEAGWDTGGAVCLSHARWLLDDAILLGNLCPDRLVPLGLLGATVCNSPLEALLFGNHDAKLFDDASILNLL